MNHLTLRCAIQLGSLTKVVIFSSAATIKEMIEKCLQKFGFEDEDSDSFYLMFAKFECIVEDIEVIKEDDTLLLKRYTDLRASTNDDSQENLANTFLKKETTNLLVERGKEVKADDMEELRGDIQTKLNISRLDDLSYQSENDRKGLEEERDEIEEEKFEIQKKKILEELDDEDNLVEEDKEDQEVRRAQREEKDGEEDEYVEIDLGEILEMRFTDRDTLSKNIKDWARLKEFILILKTKEKMSSMTKIKVTTLNCNEDECPFYLEYRGKSEYKLFHAWNKHNHPLSKKDGAQDVTPQILLRIKQLKFVAKNACILTKTINQEFNKSFDPDVIRYQLKKLDDELLGSATQDANTLIQRLIKEKEENDLFFEKKLENNKLRHFCFASKRMNLLLNQFSDVLIMDTTHKTNRFGLPLLDIVIINEQGKTCVGFIACLENSTTESFKWALEQLDKILGASPKIIFTDEEDALRNGTFYFIKY